MAQGAEEVRRSTIERTIRTSQFIWRPKEEATVSVEIREQGADEIEALPSLRLVPIPKTTRKAGSRRRVFGPAADGVVPSMEP
jgi:hypothetical protein